VKGNDGPRPGTTPEEGTSIARTGDEATFLRHRMERPALVGRYVLILLGAVTTSAGIAFWATAGSVLGLALGAFGAVLIVLGVIQHFLHKRDLDHWPTDVVLWKEGIELVLPNGDVRGATWSDSDLALELVSRRAPLPAKREYLLLWLPDSKIPPAQLSADGFERLAKLAADGGLHISQTRRGARADAVQVIRILSPPSGTSSEPPSAAGTEGS